MIKFFRQLCQRLVFENNFSKFLRYTIGGVALLMIGILLDLKVNNWYQARQSHLEEQKLLITQLDEYRNGLESLQVAINACCSAKEESHEFIKYLGSK